jgi:hypothetical protein
MGACKNCNHSVSDNAKACPQCGEPWPTKNALTKPRSALGCLFVVFLVLGILCMAGRLGAC